jgi:Zn-dependent peptidase ImmA (M78 family)
MLISQLSVNDQQILQRFMDKLPVEVANLAAAFGIEVYLSADFTDNESGSIRMENGKYVIYVNAGHSPRRQRFTIAHEIGHYLKHRSFLQSGQEMVDSTKQHVPPNQLNRAGQSHASQEERSRESEANELAGEILMPEEKFKEVWSLYNTIQEVADFFKVSESAATIRGKKLLNEFIP